MPSSAAVVARRRRSHRERGRRPWRRPRSAASSQLRRCEAQPTSTATRSLYQPQTGTPCAAAWRSRSGGTRCAAGRPASRPQRGGCDSWTSTSSSWERPSLEGFLVAEERPAEGLATGLSLRSRRSLSSSSAAQRRSTGASAWPQSTSLRFVPHVAHSPAQSGRHSGASGSSSRPPRGRAASRSSDRRRWRRRPVGRPRSGRARRTSTVDALVDLGEAAPAVAHANGADTVPVTTMPSLRLSRSTSMSISAPSGTAESTVASADAS